MIVKLMEIQVMAFGIARDILSGSKASFELPKEATVGALKQQILSEHPDFSKLASLKVAVNEEYREDEFPLSEGDEVVIIPPVSGG